MNSKRLVLFQILLSPMARRVLSQTGFLNRTFVPGGLNAILLVLCTALEDELVGYRDCARQVWVRLVPGI